MTEDSISGLIAQQTCQTLQEEKVTRRNSAEKSLFYELCYKLQKLSDEQQNLEFHKLMNTIVKQIRVQILEARIGDEALKGNTLLSSEEECQKCLQDFVVAMNQPKVLLLRYDATWLF